MDRTTELLEVKHAANEALVSIEEVMSLLNNAKHLGLWDLFGGGAIASWLKRNKMKEANAEFAVLEEKMARLKQEVADLDLPSSGKILSDTLTDSLFDVYFDNPFTDLKVQSHIKKSLKELEQLKEIVQLVQEQIDLKLAEQQ